MRILMLNYEFPPLGGGAGAVTRDLGAELVRQGHEVDCVTMHYKGLPRKEVVGGIRVFRTPAIRRTPSACTIPETFTYLLGAVRFALRLTAAEKYDVVHCHFSIPTGPLACLLRARRGLPFVITCHGADIPGYDLDRFKFAHHFTGLVNRFVMRRAAAVVSPSNWMKQLILKNVGNYNVRVIPNGLGTDQFGPKPKKKIILMSGRLIRMKNYHHVLQALEGIESDFEVHVAGDGPMRKELEGIAARLKMRVVFHGWLAGNSEELRQLYAEAAIFCMPSAAESFGLVFVEAMCAGCAVIGSTAGAIPEVVEDGVTGILVPPGDVAAIRRSLLSLMSDPVMRSRLAEAGRRHALERYSWESVCGQYARLFESIAGIGKNHAEEMGGDS